MLLTPTLVINGGIGDLSTLLGTRATIVDTEDTSASKVLPDSQA